MSNAPPSSVYETLQMFKSPLMLPAKTSPPSFVLRTFRMCSIFGSPFDNFNGSFSGNKMQFIKKIFRHFSQITINLSILRFYRLKKCQFCVSYLGMNSENFTPEQEQSLREALKRCSPETIENAVEFRKTANKALLDSVVIGIIERFAEPDKRELLRSGNDEIDMVNDLELDSLTMVEIVLCVEDALNVSIDNEDVQKLHTLADIKSYISQKIS